MSRKSLQFILCEEPREDLELGYDALPSNDSFVFLNYSYGVCGVDDHDSMFTLLQDHQHEVI